MRRLHHITSKHISYMAGLGLPRLSRTALASQGLPYGNPSAHRGLRGIRASPFDAQHAHPNTFHFVAQSEAGACPTSSPHCPLALAECDPNIKYQHYNKQELTSIHILLVICVRTEKCSTLERNRIAMILPSRDKLPKTGNSQNQKGSRRSTRSSTASTGGVFLVVVQYGPGTPA